MINQYKQGKTGGSDDSEREEAVTQPATETARIGNVYFDPKPDLENMERKYSTDIEASKQMENEKEEQKLPLVEFKPRQDLSLRVLNIYNCIIGNINNKSLADIVIYCS